MDDAASHAQESQPPQDGERLDGWKRIALYLHRDVRTLRRWENNEGLPVRRLKHDKLSTVYAYRAELDAWLEQRGSGNAKVEQNEAKTKRGWRWLWFFLPLAVLAGLMVYLWLPAKGPGIAFGKWDWVLITRFDNRTGEDVLDGTVEYALKRELGNSRYVRVVPRDRVKDALRLMRLPTDTPIDTETGREISLRDGAIRMLITGRIEKLGGTYQLSAALVNPRDGVTVASFSAEAADQAEVLPRIGDLARDVRAALGEGVASINKSAEMLAKVTTPSLEALRLFSQADAAMSGVKRNQAIPLLEQAVRLDPNFASAHLLLWYALRDRDQMPQAEQHLQRAVELADKTSERERLFILATYYDYLHDQRKSIDTYQLLVQLYPDHFWGAGNLGSIYEDLGEFRQAYPYVLQMADLRPNASWAQLKAAQMAVVNNEAATRDRYVARARNLQLQDPWLGAPITLLPVQEAWVKGDYREAATSLETLVASMDAKDLVADSGLFGQVRSLYLALGQLRRFRQISGLRPEIGWLQALLDYDSGHPETLDAMWDKTTPLSYWDAALLALTGQKERAKAIIEDPQTAEHLLPPYLARNWKNLARGQVALSEGRFGDAATLLSTDSMMLDGTSKLGYLFAMNSLAHAQQGLKEDGKAIATLEKARLQKLLSIFDPGATWMWLRNEVYLASLYRETGRNQAAAQIESELRAVLQVADSDHPFMAQLDRAPK